jgi:hypothetical protein
MPNLLLAILHVTCRIGVRREDCVPDSMFSLWPVAVRSRGVICLPSKDHTRFVRYI